jgi:hypothetical protein
MDHPSGEIVYWLLSVDRSVQSCLLAGTCIYHSAPEHQFSTVEFARKILKIVA